MSVLIGLHGPIGCGKDTLARLLVSARGAARVKFADKLYAMAAAFDPVIHPDMTHAEKEMPVLGMPDFGTRREFLQKLGTEFGRELISPDIWTTALKLRVEELWRADPTKVIVVSDVRTPNEAEMIRKLGILIHLDSNWVDPNLTNAHSSNKPLPCIPGDVRLTLKKDREAAGLSRLLDIVQAMEE